MSGRFLASLVLAWAVPIGSAHAQHMTASLAAGAVSVRFENTARFTAATLSPAARWQSRHITAAMNGTFSQVGAAGWSQQGSLVLSTITNVSARGLLGELSASIGGSRFPDGFRTSQAIGSARLHWLGRRSGVWLGAGAGTMFDGSARRALRQGEVGGVIRGDFVQLTLLATPTATDDDLSYTDMLAALSVPFGVFDATASLGGRVGGQLPLPGGDERVWGSVMVSAWLNRRLALVGGAGTYPVDPTQGFPAGRFISLGLRYGSTRSIRAALASERRAVRRAAMASGIRTLTLHRTAEGRVEIRVYAPDATTIEVQGDPTGWRATSLRADGGGWFSGVFDVSGVVVELLVRANGGAWVLPPGAEPVTDEFGGRAGRVVIP